MYFRLYSVKHSICFFSNNVLLFNKNIAKIAYA